MKLRGGRAQIRTHRPQAPLFRVTYSFESEHWENVSSYFTKKCSGQNCWCCVLWLRLQDIQQKSCLQWKMLTLCKKWLKNAQIMPKIENYAFPFGLCFVRQIMLKIMLAYCINAYLGQKLKNLRQHLVDLPFFFCSAKTVSVYRNSLKS